MTNNDVLRRLRYTFRLNDTRMLEIFSLGGATVSPEVLAGWLSHEDDAGYQPCNDRWMAGFLNGFIIARRGPREDGEQPVAEKTLDNNLVFRKLKIALDLKSEDILELLSLADFRLGPHELSAFFRKPGHKHYRECKDQVLRNFLTGLQLKHRPE